MARRTLNRRELRAAAEAAEAMGLPLASGPSGERSARDRDEPRYLRSKPLASLRMRMVWAVCDMGGRTLATFDYSDKATAEAHIKNLKQQGKGSHFLRAVKEPMQGTSHTRGS